MAERAGPSLRPVALGAALYVALFGPALRGRPLTLDRLLLEDQPLFAYIHAALREGRVPLWAPEIYAGYPLFAHMQTSFFYPPYLLAGLIGSGKAELGAVNLAWIYVPHLVLCLAATYFFALRRGLGVWGGAAAALSFGLSGALLDAYVGGCQLCSMCWFPAAMLAADRACDRRRPGDWALLGAALGLSVWAGHVQYAYFAALAAAAWSAYRLWPERRPAAWAIGMAIAAASAAGLAAIQLLPTAELATMAARSRIPYEELAADSLDPRYLLRWLWPAPYPPGPYDAAMIQPIGFAAAALALFGLTVRGRDRGFWAAAFAVAFALALGKNAPVFGALHAAGLPGLSLFKAPIRFDFLCFFALAMLAGGGMRWLVAAEPSRGAARRARAIAAGAYLVLTLLALARFGPDAAAPVQQALARDLSLLYYSAAADPAYPSAWRQGWTLSVGAAVFSLAFLAIGLGRPKRDIVGPSILIAAILAPQMWWRQAELAADDCAKADLALTRAADPAAARKYSADWIAVFAPPVAEGEGAPCEARARRAIGVGAPNLALLTGERDLSGFLNLPYARFLALTSGRWPPPRATAMGAGEAFLARPALLRALGVGEVRRVEREGPDVAPRATSEPVPGALPRLHFAGDFRVADSEGALLAGLYDPDWRPEGTVWLEGERARAAAAQAKLRIAPGGAAEVLAARFSPNEAEARVRGDGRSLLVFGETRHPGWRATVDGRPAPVLPANFLFQAIAVPEGEHDVRWVFDPVSFRLGVFATLATLAGLGTLGIARGLTRAGPASRVG